MRTRNAVARLLWGILLATQGCFLPVPYNEPGSPRLVGFMRRSDGSPAARWRVAVSNSYDDCSKTQASTTTDSAGQFELPRTLVRRYGVLLVPAFESFGNSFTLCSSRGADSAMHVIYNGFVGLTVDPPLQTVFCSEWVWEQQDRIACSTRDESKIAEGGRWSADGRHGRYRLVLTQELARARGYDRPVPRPHVYVLWIEETAAGVPLGAIETVRVPIDDKVTALSHVEILERNGRFYANFPGYRKTFLNDFASAELRFELGPPGQVTRVAEP